MSLWTPGGEHPVSDDEGIDLADLTDEEQAQLEDMATQMAAIRSQLLSVPAATVVANHGMGLYELAAIHLSVQPVHLEDARLAIDAMGALVEGLEGRLGENEAVLRDALAQLRLAFVQLRAAAGEGEGDD